MLLWEVSSTSTMQHRLQAARGCLTHTSVLPLSNCAKQSHIAGLHISANSRCYCQHMQTAVLAWSCKEACLRLLSQPAKVACSLTYAMAVVGKSGAAARNLWLWPEPGMGWVGCVIIQHS